MYRIHNKTIFNNDQPDEQKKWLELPAIVKTNRKKYTINYSRALQFAGFTNTVLVWWPSEYSNWQGRPSDDIDTDKTIDADPVFWEFFVKMA